MGVGAGSSNSHRMCGTGFAHAKNRLFTILTAFSLALGIGANTAIYSFMDAVLCGRCRSEDPASPVVVKWRSGNHQRLQRTSIRACIPSTAVPTARPLERGGISPCLRSSSFTSCRRQSSRACLRIVGGA